VSDYRFLWDSTFKLDLHLSMQSLPNTIVSLIPAYGEANLIQLYTCKIKFVFANLTGQWFSHDTLVSSTNKTYCHDITEILLRAELTRCCTLRRAKNTPTHSFVSRTVNRK
jgi:hypothetical protein